MDLSTVLDQLVPDLSASRLVQLNISGDVVCFQWLQEIRVDIKEGAYFAFDGENSRGLIDLPGSLIEKIEGTPVGPLEIVGQVRTDEPHVADWIQHLDSGHPTQKFIVRVDPDRICAIYTNTP